MKTTLQPIAFLLAALIAVPAFAQAPPILPLTGYLTDSSGTPRDGEVVLDVTLYDAAVDGTELHTESLMVTIVEGYFAAEIGTTDILDLAIFRDNSEVFVEIAVDSDVLSPRLQFGSVPYAAYAEYAADAMTVDGMTPTELMATAWGDITDVPADLLDGDDVGASSWSELTGIPADLLDGDDVGASSWSELTGIPADLLDGDDVADISGLQVRVDGICLTGTSMVSVNADGSVNCAPNTGIGSAYDAGYGLELSGSTFTVDDAVIQNRVSGVCPTGEFITAVNQDGSVDCDAPDVGMLTEENISLQGVAYITNTDSLAPTPVWAIYLNSDNVPFEGARVLISTNGKDGGGADTVGGGAGVITLQMGFCAQDVPEEVTIAIPNGLTAPVAYMSELVRMRDFSGTGVCFIRVYAHANSAADPLIIRSVQLVPDFDAVRETSP